MSTEQRRIMLTEADDGHWTAREEPGGLTAHGETPEAALGALDDANEPDIDPNAPLFSGEPFVSVEMGDESIDDVLYGSIEASDSESDAEHGA